MSVLKDKKTFFQLKNYALFAENEGRYYRHLLKLSNKNLRKAGILIKYWLYLRGVPSIGEKGSYFRKQIVKH